MVGAKSETAGVNSLQRCWIEKRMCRRAEVGGIIRLVKGKISIIV